jgi:hypothetical protein
MSENEHVLDRAEANRLDRPDQPRDEAGKFTSPNAAPEVGRQAEIHETGFRTLDDVRKDDKADKTYGSHDADLKQAFDDMKARQHNNRLISGEEMERFKGDRYVERWRDSVPQPEELPPDVALTQAEAMERISAHSKQHKAEAIAKQNLAEHEAISKDLGVPTNIDGQQQTQGEQPAQSQPDPAQAFAGIYENLQLAGQLYESDPSAAYALVKQAHAVAADPNASPEARASLAHIEQAKQQFEASQP